MSRPTAPDVGRPSGPSLQRRVGRFTLLIVTLAVLFTGLAGYLATRIAAYDRIDGVLARATTAAVAAIGPSPTWEQVDRFVSADRDLDDDLMVGALRADGEAVRAPGSEAILVDGRDLAVAAGQLGELTRQARTPDGRPYRVLVVPLGGPSQAALVIGRPLAGSQQILGALALALAACGLAAVVTAGLAARRLARAGVAPVRELTSEVERRAASDDLTPVEVVRDDEIGRLSVAFNHLLDTIKVSRVRQARFVADAGHELRTPLTSMRTNIELLLADTQRAMLPPDDRLTIMRDVRTQLIEFSSLVSDLIGLTREDRTAAELYEVDLTAVLEETVDRISMRVPGFGWDVSLDPTYLQGDADLLGRALDNVLDNAVKFSPPGGTITVSLHDGEVRVADQGRGVVQEERAFVFDRFFRSEASRATPGTGLGLSITESVVRQHGGTVIVTDAPGGGALFVLRFPLTTSRPVPRQPPPPPPPVSGDARRPRPITAGGAEA
ncbi:sensor histidine kinase [Microlunatus flavus]|uniref:histidine kinase n=1 Tax=Microlunatus flavus TaxID=1036181 RepID=A0A1H9MCZ5_9ACTN|nr:HAMP domain-containing sensor histidine kinase [Microlunatus flavus]SER21544.1 two-component system, OmpR family, sensor histidine kinase MprB [Microlunatus flavus]